MSAPLSAPAPFPAPASRIASGDGFVDAFGGRYYRIADVDALPPFFLALASASDCWAYLASNGALTAGRGDAETCLFPYQSVDRLYDQPGRAGPYTVLGITQAGRTEPWLPFAPRVQRDPAVRRHLYKSIEGDRVWFEEIHERLQLRFRYGWATAARHGLVRTCELENLGNTPVEVRLLDGLLNLQPAGVPRRVQDTSSCLADAYKTAELLADSPMAVYALSAGIVDRPDALESLRASLVWSGGLDRPHVLLSPAQLNAWLEDGAPDDSRHCRGVRTHYLLATTLRLAPGDRRDWFFVADIGLDQTEVTRRHQTLASNPDHPAIRQAVDATTQHLRTLVAQADGIQRGGDEMAAAHHFANVLFNIMRGGTFADGHVLRGEDFARHVAHHNRAAATRHAAFLAGLPAELPRASLLARVSPLGDPDLLRLATEYLPLIFSRRHGDPSRPWNRFRIRLQDERGRRLHAYEGNWRDIFQNWEALCWSYPGFLDAVVARFLSASTADGYNPYRISQAGIDWEVPDPEDPWASIGYWGDHQVVYLQRLLEWAERFQPDGLLATPRAPRFAYAAVPYRIAGYEQLRRNPKETIEFRGDLHRTIEKREREAGADARLLTGTSGRVRHANLVEKLLVLLLTRATNFVPGGGIWMNTQRPEWNDANNALVGHGVSVVTLGYLRRMLAHVEKRFLPRLGSEPVDVAEHVITLLGDATDALAAHRTLLEQPSIDDASRRRLLDALARAGERYRSRIYGEGLGAVRPLPVSRLAEFCSLFRRFADHTLAANRRPDGLYHAYNLLEFAEQPAVLRLHRLDVMLEGQVSILSSGLLAPAEAVGLLRALRQSPLYRADQHSYLLYPDRTLPGFLERNVIPGPLVQDCALLTQLIAAGDLRLVQRDAAGRHRFHADLVNADAIETRLAELAGDPRWAPMVAADAGAIRAAYETVFHHHAFTGRSGTMFGYEGLGCIYWHMVAKLLLAVQENFLAARAAGAPEAGPLAVAYDEVCRGLGCHKTPAAWGAFPTDPYSHTPGHGGAQQPGMTGQVKEEILTRWGELGVVVDRGCVRFDPTLLGERDFTATGDPDPHALGVGALGFTLCGVPVVYRLTTGPATLAVHFADGTRRTLPGRALDAALSAQLLARDGELHRIDVDLGGDYQPRS